MKTFVKIAVVLTCLVGLSSCKALFGNYTREDVQRNYVEWMSADQPPESLNDHTFVRYEAPSTPGIQYFKSDGTFFEFKAGDSQIRTGRWRKTKPISFSLESEKICFSHNEGEQCRDYDDWYNENLQSHATDYLNLSSRKFTPCLLENSQFYVSNIFVISRTELNKNDTLSAAQNECISFMHTLISHKFFGDKTKIKSDLKANSKHYFECIFSMPESSLLITESDKDIFRNCNHEGLKPDGIEGAQEFLAFNAAHRDLSIYSNRKRKALGID